MSQSMVLPHAQLEAHIYCLVAVRQEGASSSSIHLIHTFSKTLGLVGEHKLEALSFLRCKAVILTPSVAQTFIRTLIEFTPARIVFIYTNIFERLLGFSLGISSLFEALVGEHRVLSFL